MSEYSELVKRLEEHALCFAEPRKSFIPAILGPDILKAAQAIERLEREIEITKASLTDAEKAEQQLAEARAEIEQLRHASPDDLRSYGWTVAVHNDYRQNGENHTFWLLTMEDHCIKGEGKTDAEALDQIRALATPEPKPESFVFEGCTFESTPGPYTVTIDGSDPEPSTGEAEAKDVWEGGNPDCPHCTGDGCPIPHCPYAAAQQQEQEG